MFRHILVPLDGSDRAEQALPIAVRLARASGGTITLLCVVNIAQETLSYGVAGPYIPQTSIENDLAGAEDYLDQLLQRSSLADMSVDKQTALGNPAVVILSTAEEQGVDLIVMSSHGYTGVKRWLMGSVAEKVVHLTHAPVLILRDGMPLRTHRDLDGSNKVRALVPLDTSARSQDVIPLATELVAALSTPGHGELHLTQIVVMPEHTSQAERDELFQGAGRNLDAIGQSIRDELVEHVGPELHLRLGWSVSLDSDIAEGIVRIAESGETTGDAERVERCDLIAMTTHGSTGIHRWAVGSITERVLRATRLPLLIVRPADIIAKERQHMKNHVTTAK
jgi:nucleotide-binding universal stress UspA family protein